MSADAVTSLHFGSGDMFVLLNTGKGFAIAGKSIMTMPKPSPWMEMPARPAADTNDAAKLTDCGGVQGGQGPTVS